jgi:hypothetical protein
MDIRGLIGVASEGLLAEHVLPSADGRGVPRCVEAVGQWVVHDLHLRVVDHLAVAVMDPLDVILSRVHFGPLPVAGRNRDEPVPQLVRWFDD